MVNVARVLFISLLIGACSAVTASGQVVNELERSRYSPAAYYNYSEPGDVTMLVNVWGSVRNPGLYEVPVDTRLGAVLSLAGGPSSGSTRWNQRQRTTLRIIRPLEGGEEVVFERVLEDALFVPTVNPELQDNDTVTVEQFTKELFTWRDALSIVSASATFALLVDRVVNLTN